MAYEVTWYEEPRTGTYYVNIPKQLSPSGKRIRRSLQTKSKKVAAKKVRDIEADLQSGVQGLTRQRRVDAETFIDDYIRLNKSGWSEATVTNRTYRLRAILLDDRVDWPPTPSGLIDFWTERVEAGEIVVNTVNSERNELSQALNWAVENGYLAANPVDKVKPFRNGEDENDGAKVDWFDADEISLILENIPDDYIPIVEWSVATGWRLSECLRLRWEHVGEDRVKCLGKGRGGYKVRRTPLSAVMREILSRIPRDGEYEDGPFPFKRHTVSQAFRRARERVGIDHGDFHVLRHTFATRLIEEGTDIYIVSHLLGHSNLEITRKHYAHVMPERKATELDRLAKYHTNGGNGHAD